MANLLEYKTKQNLEKVINYFAQEYQMFEALEKANLFFRGKLSPEITEEIRPLLVPKNIGGRKKVGEPMKVKLVDGVLTILNDEGVEN